MSSEKKPNIKPAPDGPYLVKGLKNFANQKGPIEAKETMALCRCGESANKPFCDGTHSKIGFSSAKLAGLVEDKRENYPGKKITIHDNRGICAHAGRCNDGLAAVFRLKEEPWIHPDAASADEIIATIQQCPSGALSYSVAYVEHGERDGEPTIFVAPTAPMWCPADRNLAIPRGRKGPQKDILPCAVAAALRTNPFVMARIGK